MTSAHSRPRLVTGLMPIGQTHLGTFLSTIRPLAKDYQYTHNVFLLLADMHAITMQHPKESILSGIYHSIATILACGIDPNRTTILLQSKVHWHSEMAWILQCQTPIRIVSKYTPIAKKIKLHMSLYGGKAAEAPIALLTYGLLQASDILVYGGVPPEPLRVLVGSDQANMVLLCQEIARRFNDTFGFTLSVPELLTDTSLMDLSGVQKMARGLGPKERARIFELRSILLGDSESTIKEKIEKFIPSDARFHSNDPKLVNLRYLYQSLGGGSFTDLKDFSQLRDVITEIVITELKPIQMRYREIMSNSELLLRILLEGSEKASVEAGAVVAAVKLKLGLGLLDL